MTIKLEITCDTPACRSKKIFEGHGVTIDGALRQAGRTGWWISRNRETCPKCNPKYDETKTGMDGYGDNAPDFLRYNKGMKT